MSLSLRLIFVEFVAINAFVLACSSDSDDGSVADSGGDARAKQDTGGEFPWTWIDVPESKCRDGSSTGIGVNLNSASHKVVIYLEGGGACFNTQICAMNVASYSKSLFSDTYSGIFNRFNEDNPVKDWNYVYVPYCSGDLHAGNASADPGNGTPQEFRGYNNLELFLDYIVTTIKEVKHVLLTGPSAGGLGAMLTADLVGRTFGPETTFTVVDDSGPLLSSDYLNTCLQKRWRELWDFDSTVLKDCGTACPDPDNYSIDWSLFIANKYPRANIGLISATQDVTIAAFYAYRTNDCTATTSSDFKAGLMDYRTKVQSVPNIGTYYITSIGHTWIVLDDTFYNTTVGNVRLVDWLRDLLEGKAPTHVGP